MQMVQFFPEPLRQGRHPRIHPVSISLNRNNQLVLVQHNELSITNLLTNRILREPGDSTMY